MQNQNQNVFLEQQILENKNNESKKDEIEKENETENKEKILEENDKLKNNELLNLNDFQKEIEEENLKKLDENQVILIKQVLQKIQNNIDQIFQIIKEIKPNQKEKYLIIKKSLKKLKQNFNRKEELITEGVFDGQNMIGPDGKKYIVPINYASKSKLIEGDILKLTILDDGSFIYKQTEPVQRERLKGLLVKDREANQWEVLAGGNIYKVLTTSVTYFKGEINNEAVILVPKGNRSQWAAIENIIKL
ncbi:MAG: hypothetical protein ABH808_03065 [Candidatus Kuenenbacteria bacterium]